MTLAIHRSSKLIPEFSLHRPETVDEALAIAKECRGTCAFMAGGVNVINAMKTGRSAENIIHLGRLGKLQEISLGKDSMSVGAGVSLWRLQVSPEVQARLPQLSQAVAEVANVRIRMKVTVGGNIMARSGAFEMTPLMMALNARAIVMDVHGQRFSTSLQSIAESHGLNDLLVALEIPTKQKTWLGFERSLRPAIGMTVGIDLIEGQVAQVRIGLSCCYDQAFLDTIEFPSLLKPSEVCDGRVEIAEQWAARLPPPLDDHLGTSKYRRRMAAVLLERIIAQFASKISMSA